MKTLAIVNRKDVKDKYSRIVLDKETHHDHEIVDDNGTLRWKQNPAVNKAVDSINLNNIILLFIHLGINKNSEVYRKLYRDMGYSLYGYWEIFYWDMNNEEADEYDPSSDDPKALLSWVINNTTDAGPTAGPCRRYKGKVLNVEELHKAFKERNR